MSERSKCVKVAIWHPDSDTRETLCAAVDSLAYEITGTGDKGVDLIKHATGQESDSEVPDLVICGIHLRDRNGVRCLIEIAEQRAIPAIVVTDDKSLASVEKALEDHVMAYLVEPIRESEIRPTIYLVLRRFEQFEELKEEVRDLQESLQVRKLIERAKATIMRRSDIDEESAYQRLRRFAMDNRIRMAEAAEKILEVESTYRGN